MLLVVFSSINATIYESNFSNYANYKKRTLPTPTPTPKKNKHWIINELITN